MATVRDWAKTLLTRGGTPHGIAGGFALGLTLSLIPIPFLGMVLALALAPRARLNLPATYAGTAVINPVTGAFVYATELALGAFILQRDVPAFAEMKTMGAAQWWELFQQFLPAFLLGAVVLAGVFGTASYVVLRAVTTRLQPAKKTAAPMGSDRSSSSTER